MSVYELKSRFQTLLRPAVTGMASAGITANQVTLAAAAGSLFLGWLLFGTPSRMLYLFLPVWLFLRMALNAADGMLAREFGQKSDPGFYLNEIGDVISDAALYAPFMLVAPFSPFWITIIAVLSALTEFCGVLALAGSGTRAYHGPMGKSDRAVVFGVLGLLVAITSALPAWFVWLQPILVVFLVVTCVKRVKAGLGVKRG